jgi:hypothetical protein
MTINWSLILIVNFYLWSLTVPPLKLSTKPVCNSNCLWFKTVRLTPVLITGMWSGLKDFACGNWCDGRIGYVGGSSWQLAKPDALERQEDGENSPPVAAQEHFPFQRMSIESLQPVQWILSYATTVRQSISISTVRAYRSIFVYGSQKPRRFEWNWPKISVTPFKFS